MKQLLFSAVICAGLTLACSPGERRPVETARLLPEPDIQERLQYQKSIADTLFNRSKDKLIVFVKLVDQEDLVEVKNAEFPDGVETTYNVLKDSLGQIVSISEFPFSESGDWYISLTHYFDKAEKTFAFERATSFFNSMCVEDDGVAFERISKFYDGDFNLIDTAYFLVDGKKAPLQKDSCQFPYDYPYEVMRDLEKYLNTKDLKK